MKSISIFALATSLLLSANITIAQPMGGPMMGGGMMKGGGMMGNSSPRRFYAMRNGIPPQFSTMRNPLSPTASNIAAGKQLYAAQCAACHGSSGHGDGPAGAQLNPPPSDLTFAVHTPIASDGYLYWTLAEGGTPIGSAMPAFRNSLSIDDAWKIILYLRQL